MSISTRKGDEGETALLFGRRLSKTHPRVEAYGSVDELTAAIGVARASAEDEQTNDILLQMQKDLWVMSGELAVDDQDRDRFEKSHFLPIMESHLHELDKRVKELEARTPPFNGFVQPGATLFSAHLHLARTICRRAEREVLRLRETSQCVNPISLQYLNRLSDVLWLMAREDEVNHG